ncbi:MAG: RNA pseudouridine synthase [Deltaproteobacteria bacterium]|nr:RNA pseudouridine synthase [Deltaproteobacteria bacterium]
MHFFHPRWPVFYEDNHILSLYKPAGLLMQGDRTGSPCLLDLARGWIKKRYHKPGRVFLGMVHRLDRPVAGIILFAKTSKAASRLSAQIRDRRVRKGYLAVVEGRVASPSGALSHCIEYEKRRRRPKESTQTSVREARLSFRVLEATGNRSLLRIDLETGRKHQIRIQLARIGHPVAGDVRYGASTPLLFRRIALFSKEIAFQHPTRQEKIVLSSPLPEGWPWTRRAGDATPPLWSREDFPPALFLTVDTSPD